MFRFKNYFISVFTVHVNYIYRVDFAQLHNISYFLLLNNLFTFWVFHIREIKIFLNLYLTSFKNQISFTL